MSTPSRLTPDHINSLITATDFFYHDMLTICVLTLANGFKITGTSSCVATENYDRNIGEGLAKAVASEKIWELEGYLLRQKRFEEGLE